ncbi:MAG: hypothetical protein JWO20_1248 [Candidatus Angelobacter sp.]|jgi:hypothetical protein|nr:hypothetical protein [Candidatus Angelobacter sp.]
MPSSSRVVLEKRPMAKFGWMIATFGVMYAIASLVGFGLFLLINPTTMWIGVFTLMPVVSAALMRWYLAKMQFSRKETLRESLYLVGAWIAFSFGLDAIVYILIVPRVNHTSPNWRFFAEQSPWIWLSYLALVVAGYAARLMYLRSCRE